MASTQQQQQDNWFASIEKEVIQNQSRQQPTRRSTRSASTGTTSAPLSANSGSTTPRPSGLDHNREDYFARQSCLNSGAQTRNTPQQKDPTYQQRLLAMIPDTPSISLNTLSLSNVIPASVPNMQSIFGRTTLPAKQMESLAAPPATGFGNTTTSSSHSFYTPVPHSPEIFSFSSSSANPPLNVASAYPSGNSMLTSTYNSTKAAVASFSLGFSNDSTTTSSNSQYTPPAGSSGKVAQAYPGQTSLLNSTKAAVSKLAQTVSSATKAVSSSKNSPTRSGGYGYGDAGQRDSSSTLHEGGKSGGPTNSSWSKANDSWGGFADDGGKRSLTDVANVRRSSEAARMAEALQPW